MARGWESKAVEAQIEEAFSKPQPGRAHLTVEAAARVREREGLLLHRTRVLHDIGATRNPRYQEVLKAGLAHLDERLTQME